MSRHLPRAALALLLLYLACTTTALAQGFPVRPITMAAKNILVLVANPAFAPNPIAEPIDHAKKHPGKLSYGSSGSGSPCS